MCRSAFYPLLGPLYCTYPVIPDRQCWCYPYDDLQTLPNTKNFNSRGFRCRPENKETGSPQDFNPLRAGGRRRIKEEKGVLRAARRTNSTGSKRQRKEKSHSPERGVGRLNRYKYRPRCRFFTSSGRRVSPYLEGVSKASPLTTDGVAFTSGVLRTRNTYISPEGHKRELPKKADDKEDLMHTNYASQCLKLSRVCVSGRMVGEIFRKERVLASLPSEFENSGRFFENRNWLH